MDLFNIFRDHFNRTLDSGLMDYSYVCLIPKKECAKAANDFRPISLINGVQKTVSKVLANRLEASLTDIISPTQVAFIKGRSILDSFTTASEIVNWCTKAGIDIVGFKADFEKAYDRVSWGFVSRAMMWLGADSRWCAWIERCLTNAKIAILVNGAPTKWIRVRRGLRQGDPLSPYLFLLVAEGMVRLVDRAVSSNLLRGVGPTDSCKVSCIQYADDTIFFYEARLRQVRNLCFMLELFAWASRLKINKTKSELLYLGQEAGKGEWLAAALGCKLGSFPLRYLGLPLTNRRPGSCV